ncbi:MAG: CotH kinase family protein [Eubacterium sp.]|nr:CotH kinase family protein [Eubacterium sp.]
MLNSSTVKRIVLLAVLAVVGVAAAWGLSYAIGEGSEYEILQPVQPPITADQPEKPRVPITFSHTDTFYEESFSVALTAAEEDAVIYYTTDGSVPTRSSTRYVNPINVRAGKEVKSFTIKAIAIGEEGTSEVITKSYVVGADVFERFDKDTYVFVLSADPHDLYDYYDGIAVEGVIRDEWLQNEYDGTFEVNPTHPANWNQDGMDGERPMYMEVYDSAGNLLIEQQAGARVAGAYSRATGQKSWKLIARRLYTPDDGTFHFVFFDDATDADGVLLTKYDRIVLRNGANDREFAGVRDELSAELAAQSGFLDYQSTAPAAVFLNGEYYGFAWLHQNYCKGYLESRYGGNKDNFQIVGKAEGAIDEEENEGGEDYNKVLELAEGGLTDDAKFEEFCSMVDIDNYMHYLAMQLFIDNRDWPGNNYKAWRYVADEGEEVDSEYLDGKWRYLFFDAEFAWGLYSDGFKNATLSRILNNTHPAGGSVMIAALMEREDMREKLANNICDLIGGAFSTENILAVLEEKLAISDSEQFYALDHRITSEWANRDTFANSRNEIRQFAQYRSKVILQDLRRVFELEEDTFTVTVTGAQGIKAKLNLQNAGSGETVSAEYFTAYGVPLSAESYSGWEFTYFEINGERYTDSELTITADMADKDGNVKVVAYAAKTVADVPVYISEVYTGGDADWIELHNPNDFTVTLKDMYLTDDENVLNMWSIPTVSLGGGDTIRIVCKNNSDASALLKLQTNFSLKAGEMLILSDSSGAIYGRVAVADCDENETQVRKDDGTYEKRTA